MRRLVIMFGVLLAGCGGSDSTTTPPHSSGPFDVFTPGNVFSPFTTTMSVGGTIVFHISGSPEGHNVIFGKSTPGAPADINVVITANVSRTFSTRGTFSYDCTVHPGMTGQVVVQ